MTTARAGAGCGWCVGCSGRQPTRAVPAAGRWWSSLGQAGGPVVPRPALGTVDDATAIAKIFINTNLAACGGVIANALITRFLTGKTDVIMMLNGCLGGLVAITAEPLAPSPGAAIIIGAIGGAIVVLGSKLLIKLKIDDVVDGNPVNHIVETTTGRVIFNELVPAEVGFVNEVLTKKSLREIFQF